MTLPQIVKEVVGKATIRLAMKSFPMRSLLSPIGLRTRKEWFPPGVAVKVRGPEGQPLILCDPAQNYFSFQLFWGGTGYYEPLTQVVLSELLARAGCFLDIGANIGFFSLLAGLQARVPQAYAFEPHPRLYRLLSANLAANGFNHIQSVPVAISNQVGEISFYVSGSDMSGSIESHFSHKQEKAVTVHTTTLDAFFAEHQGQPPFVIKLDVEGHEPSVLEGAMTFLTRQRPDIVIEVATEYRTEPYPRLRELGYNYYAITAHGLVRSESLKPCIENHFWHSNFLFSVRPPEELAELSRAVREAAGRIDLTASSETVDDAKIKRLRSHVKP